MAVSSDKTRAVSVLWQGTVSCTVHMNCMYCTSYRSHAGLSLQQPAASRCRSSTDVLHCVQWQSGCSQVMLQPGDAVQSPSQGHSALFIRSQPYFHSSLTTVSATHHITVTVIHHGDGWDMNTRWQDWCLLQASPGAPVSGASSGTSDTHLTPGIFHAS